MSNLTEAQSTPGDIEDSVPAYEKAGFRSPKSVIRRCDAQVRQVFRDMERKLAESQLDNKVLRIEVADARCIMSDLLEWLLESEEINQSEGREVRQAQLFCDHSLSERARNEIDRLRQAFRDWAPSSRET